MHVDNDGIHGQLANLKWHDRTQNCYHAIILSSSFRVISGVFEFLGANKDLLNYHSSIDSRYIFQEIL